jgi:hypothetical protein
MTVIFWRTIDSLTSEMSCPSISILPSVNSTILDRARHRVDFPAPVLPTTPTLCPGSTVKDSLCSTSSVVGLYLRVTSLNSTLPC